MQATKPIEIKAAPRATKDNAGKAEQQLSLILNDIQNDFEGSSPVTTPVSAHENVTRALVGYKLTDLAALVIGFFAAWGVAYTVDIVYLGRSNLSAVMQGSLISIAQSLLVGCGIVVWFWHNGHYRMRMPFWIETRKIIEGTAFAMLVDIFLRCIVKQDFSRLWLISAWVFAAVGMIVLRSIWRDRMRKKGLWKVATLLVGHGAMADEARRALAQESGLGFDIVGQIDNLQAEFQKAGRSWKTLCSQHNADYVVIALEGNELATAGQAFAQLMRENVPFSVAPPLHSIPVFGMTPHYFFNHDVMLLTHNHGLNQRLHCIVKRCFDVVLSSLALLALSPVLAVVALLIKMDGGTILFGHKRLGLNGQYFHCLKFRSMVVDSAAVLKKHLANNPEAQAEWQATYKLQHDPRITYIGRVLRRTSLDELPQLWNVLRGEMSLVGPRPIIIAEAEKYDNDISHYYRVRPGITGLWQVSGRSDVSYGERVRMDSWYVRNWSLWHDIAIICKTFDVVLKGRGAY